VPRLFRRMSKSGFTASASLALVDGNIGEVTTAERIMTAALAEFGSIHHLVNNAGIYGARPFYRIQHQRVPQLRFHHLEGFIFITQLAVKQFLEQKSGGSVISITASLADNPIAGAPSSIPIITKGGLNAITISLASEYAKQHIRFNAVAPGIVDTSLTRDNPKDSLKTLNPMGVIAEAKDIADAVVYLAEARNVTREVMHVDGGAHVGRW
jgi:NAD(P)-dependent dehydrogenase (short-subunit alcohol dehydrogenase family)